MKYIFLALVLAMTIGCGDSKVPDPEIENATLVPTEEPVEEMLTGEVVKILAEYMVIKLLDGQYIAYKVPGATPGQPIIFPKKNLIALYKEINFGDN